jgi:CheY-like chemotaxis protein
MKNRRIILAAVIIAVIVVGHVLVYQYVASVVTQAAWDEVNNQDRARGVRLLLQVPMLVDLALLCGLIAWAAVWSHEIKESGTMRERLTSMRRALEKDRRLSSSADRVNALMEHLPQGLLLFDGEGRLLLANAAAIGRLNLDRKPLAEVAFRDVLSSGAVDDFDVLLDALRGHGSHVLNLQMQPISGKPFLARGHLHLFQGAMGETLISVVIEANTETHLPVTQASQNTTGAVLVADDEELVRLLMKSMIERMGYRPLVCGTGDEAIEVFTAHQAEIDAVVLDISMPGIDGIETSRRILAVAPDVPVVFCSGVAELPSDVASDQQVRLIRKPFSFEDFSLAVLAAIDRRGKA